MDTIGKLRGEIVDKIYSNGAQLITGDILQDILVYMTDTLNFGRFGGVITPEVKVDDLDDNYFYLALTEGIYNLTTPTYLPNICAGIVYYEKSKRWRMVNILLQEYGEYTNILPDRILLNQGINGNDIVVPKVGYSLYVYDLPNYMDSVVVYQSIDGTLPFRFFKEPTSGGELLVGWNTVTPTVFNGNSLYIEIPNSYKAEDPTTGILLVKARRSAVSTGGGGESTAVPSPLFLQNIADLNLTYLEDHSIQITFESGGDTLQVLMSDNSVIEIPIGEEYTLPASNGYVMFAKKTDAGYSTSIQAVDFYKHADTNILLAIVMSKEVVTSDSTYYRANIVGGLLLPLQLNK